MGPYYERRLQLLDEPVRDATGIGRPGAFEQDDELVAAKTRDRVFRSQARFETSCDGREELVSYGVSEAVVYDLEVV